MAEFSELVVTRGGQALLAKMLEGSDGIRLTNVSVSGTVYDEQQLEELTALTDIRQTSSVSKIRRTNKAAIEVEAAFTNADLTEGYHIQTLGLYAVDPDEGEILYAVTKERSGCCYMPAHNGVTMSGILITLVMTVGNAENVSLEVNPAGIATLKDVQEVQKEMQELKVRVGEHTIEADVPPDAIFANMTGAAQEKAGQAGYVPAPAQGEQEKYFRGDGTWQMPLDTLTAVWANTESGYLVSALALKEAVGIVMTGTLPAGETTLELTDSELTDDSMISIYTDVYGICPKEAGYRDGALTLVFEAQETDVQVKVRVM